MVAGAGALGSWLGGALSLGGADVTLVARGAHRDALIERGLTVLTPSGHRSARPEVTGTIAEAFSGRGHFDLALIAVKSYDAQGVASEIVQALNDHPDARCGALATFQNGVGNEALVSATTAGVIPGPVVAATLTTAVRLIEPGTVEGGAKGGVGIALCPEGSSDMLAQALTAGGLRVSRYEDAAAMKWSKLLLNMIGSATSAILSQPPAQLFRDRRIFEIEVDAWLEALGVMQALGLRPVALPGYPVPTYAWLLRRLPAPLRFPLLAGRLAGSRGDRLPGVAADLAAGRSRSEIRALHGAVAAAGDAMGVDAPVNRALNTIVLDLAEGRLERARFAERPEALLTTLREMGA